MLGGDAQGQGAEEYEVRPGTAVFIPGGTFHRVKNDTDEDFVMLTIWPKTPAPGANSAFDGRKKVWGTTFRLVTGKS
jgi:oxalate decarboxylase/phosphoglucose isomerase-like protein (cupin superfamily)